MRELTRKELDAVAGGYERSSSKSFGNGNGDGNSNTSGVIIAGVGNGNNVIQQTGNTSSSGGNKHP
jgi:hypothetical protein